MSNFLKFIAGINLILSCGLMAFGSFEWAVCSGIWSICNMLSLIHYLLEEK